ncbi:MAG: phosphotransferase [Hyphomicrobiales bacterium]|nr:phosphotransferase [Hyphomicrobiales bacterium]MCP4997685.1 phosphotransferase [Hyphomicrobiales bacterium]
MSLSVVQNVLSLWGLEGCDAKLVAQRENRVFRVTGPDGCTYALRLHRPGYRSDAELYSELEWLAELHRCGLQVPLPVASQEGAYLHHSEVFPVSLLTWLPGKPMGETGGSLNVADRLAAFRAVGEAMARMHMVSDEWRLPLQFERCSWDFEGLLGDNPLWGRFWENPQLTPQQRNLIAAARDRAQDDLRAIEQTQDYGLIHADLVRENVLLSKGALQLIDFDDGGFGFRLFDIATTLNKNRREPDYTDLEAALVEGYARVRPTDTSDLQLFMLLRAFTYLGWIMTRMDEPGASVRCARFIANAVEMSRDYLATETAR